MFRLSAQTLRIPASPTSPAPLLCDYHILIPTPRNGSEPPKYGPHAHSTAAGGPIPTGLPPPPGSSGKIPASLKGHVGHAFGSVKPPPPPGGTRSALSSGRAPSTPPLQHSPLCSRPAPSPVASPSPPGKLSVGGAHGQHRA